MEEEKKPTLEEHFRAKRELFSKEIKDGSKLLIKIEKTLGSLPCSSSSLSAQAAACRA